MQVSLAFLSTCQILLSDILYSFGLLSLNGRLGHPTLFHLAGGRFRGWRSVSWTAIVSSGQR
jgi:hypothetical protein